MLPQPTATHVSARPSWLRTRFIVGGVVALVLMTLVALKARAEWRAMHGVISPLDFDPVAWKAAPARHRSLDSVRLRMADSFLSTQRPVGKSRDEVVKLLGEPEEKDYFREDYQMVYFLGPERGFMSIDSEWLVFKLSGESVVEAKIVRD